MNAVGLKLCCVLTSDSSKTMSFRLWSPPRVKGTALQMLPSCLAAGLTLTEAQNINRSLLELGNVISALMQTAPHIPYRSAPALYYEITSNVQLCLP